jgi:hypothetical protein
VIPIVIKLTHASSRGIVRRYNFSSIRSYHRDDGDDITYVDVDDGGDSYIRVRETPEEIDALIDEAVNKFWRGRDADEARTWLGNK